MTTVTGGDAAGGGTGCARFASTSARASAPSSPTGSPSIHARMRAAARSLRSTIANGSPPSSVRPSKWAVT